MKLTVPSDHKALRKKEYPPIGDQLDDMWRVIQQLRDSGVQVESPMLDLVRAVKSKYPKKVDNPKPWAIL